MAVPATIFYDPNKTPLSVGQDAVTPKAAPTNQEKYNERMWGSRSLQVKYDQDGHQYWHSSLTGSDYSSLDAAHADENFYTTNYDAWNQQGKIDPMAAATGAQAPVENPTAPTNDIVNQTIADLTPPAAAAPRPVATRAGFTNELSAVPTRQVVGGGTPRSNPYTQIDGSAVDPTRLAGATPAAGAGGGAGPSINTTDPGSPAPTVDRTKIDAILNPLGDYTNRIADLANDNTGQSVAEAQLMKADQLAKIRARDELAMNQAGALGAARSARNAGDRRLLERQAIGEQAYLGSQAQRQDVLRQAELEGNLAELRANETNYDREFKLKALDTAANLGLNRAALEADIGKADLASATEWIRQEFQQLGLDKQLGQSADQFAASLNADKMKTILGFTQAMAAIQYQYDQLSVTDQNEADKLLMQKYNIDQDTMVALKKIKQDGRFRWDNVLTALVGGAATGGTGAAANVLLGGGKGGSSS